MRSWRPPTHRRSAILIPSAAAGVTFLVSSGVFALLESNRPIGFDPAIAAAIGVAILAIPIGFFLALLPMLVGVIAMHWLGSWNLGMRHPAAWGLAGGGMAAAIVIALANGDFDPYFGLAPGFVATGTLCALLARGYVRWRGDDPAN